MKHKLQTMLKHKLQWLLLLAALLGVSQGIWANGSAAGPKGVYLNVNGTQTWYNVYSTSWDYTPACSGWGFKTATSISGQNLGTVTTLRIDGFAVIGWTDNADWVSGQLRWKVDSGSYKYYKVGNYGNCSGGVSQVQCTSGNDRVVGYKSSTDVNVLSGLSVGNHTLYLKPYGQMLYNCGNFNSVDHTELSATFTVPGWSTTSGSKAFGSVNVGSNSSATISLGTHYGATSTATSSVTGTNASDFSVTSVSATSVTVIFTPSAAGSRTATVTITDAYSKTYTLSVSGTGVTSCTTPTDSDIEISAPASTTTLYLGTGSEPSVTQTVTATCSKGNTYLWSATPTSMSYTGAWGAGTATRAAITSSSSKSTTATFYHEGVYTATFKAGCSNTTDASKAAPTITVKPGRIYFDGPFFSGSNYDLTKHVVEINTSTDQFVYEWTAAYTSGDFVISVGNYCGNLASSAYTIGNYAVITTDGVTMSSASTENHNFSPNIGTIAVGERLKLTVSYTGVNSSGVPKYTVKLEKVCSNPTVQTVSGTATICSGSSTNVTVASSQSGYTYKLYKGGSATATTKAGTGSALNFSVSEAGTYTVHAYYTSGADAYCKADMTGSATVTVTPTASIGSVTLTSSSVCIGQGLSATANSVELGGGTGAWSSSNTSIATVASTGVITPKAAGSTNITYTITGGCGGTVSKYATLTVKPNAAAAQYTLTNNTQTYNGAPRAVTVTPASGAGTATIYYTGTGGTSYAKSTTAPINAGTYAITVNAGNGTNYCAATDLSVGTLTINKANQSTLTISNTATDLVYCDAANVKLTTSGGSGDGAVTYTVTSGSGSVDGDVLSPSAKGSVSVTATKAASQNFNATTSEPKTFNFNKTAPTVYTLSNVGDATTICGDPSSGAGSGTLRLSNSQTGYSYQLYSNGSPVEGSTAKAGTTGSSIDFPVTSSGTYTVYGYYGSNSSNCPTLMDGEITLTISTQPRLVRSAAKVSQYTPVTVTCISTDIETWEVTNAGSTAYLYDQTYNSVDFKGASTNSPYTITATTKGGCSETTTITVNTDHEDCN